MQKNDCLTPAMQSQFSQTMFENNLWWSICFKDDVESVHASLALENILGRKVDSIDSLMGKYVTALPKLKIQEAIENISAQKEDVTRFVVSFETTKGKRSYQNQIVTVTQQPHLTFLVNCLDVTEMVEFEREMVDAQGRLTVSQVYEKQKLLENQNRMIAESYTKQSRFLGFLSHELRSPLLGISSLVTRLRERLRQHMGDDTESEVMLKTISMTAQQSTYLVNDILTYTQTEYDGLTLHASHHSLHEILENVKQLTKSLALDKNLNLSVVRLIRHDEIFVDSVRLTQVLINLIVNGIKFTEFGGINLEVKELQKGQYRFLISDSGEGIAQVSLQKIFQPFAQIDAEEKQRNRPIKYLGAGLGLFVVKELVEAMGGKIRVRSQEHVGTQFEFTLNLLNESQHANSVRPLNESHSRSKESEKNTEVAPSFASQELSSRPMNAELSKLKILVADDSEINRMVIVGYLQELQCQIVEAADGRIAWRKAQHEHFDFILLDIQMPWLDGFEVAQKIKTLKQSGGQKPLKAVFAITAGGETENFDELTGKDKALLFDEWLVKPVSKNQIIDLLKRYMSGEAGEIIADEPAKERNTQPQPAETPPENPLEERKVEITEKNQLKEQIPEAFHHLISPFAEEMQNNITDLIKLNNSENWSEIPKLAHYMKGNAMLFQLDEIVSLCKQLEVLNDPSSNEISDNERQTQSLQLIGGLKSILDTIDNAFNS